MLFIKMRELFLHVFVCTRGVAKVYVELQDLYTPSLIITDMGGLRGGIRNSHRYVRALFYELTGFVFIEFFIVVVLLLNVHGKLLWSCRGGQLT